MDEKALSKIDFARIILRTIMEAQSSDHACNKDVAVIVYDVIGILKDAAGALCSAPPDAKSNSGHGDASCNDDPAVKTIPSAVLAAETGRLIEEVREWCETAAITGLAAGVFRYGRGWRLTPEAAMQFKRDIGWEK